MKCRSSLTVASSSTRNISFGARRAILLDSTSTVVGISTYLLSKSVPGCTFLQPLTAQDAFDIISLFGFTVKQLKNHFASFIFETRGLKIGSSLLASGTLKMRCIAPVG